MNRHKNEEIEKDLSTLGQDAKRAITAIGQTSNSSSDDSQSEFGEAIRGRDETRFCAKCEYGWIITNG
ncbi:MAG: hypothetical protein JKX97_08485, partial [Candidatus Lindowbacteria bacterium]|nr:hypothetical protein [Candidatus Lindowbacteria bacterium]